MSAKSPIAERELLYSIKGDRDCKKFVVRIGAPYLVDADSVSFTFDPGTAACSIEFVGLPEDSIDVYGIDLIHALTMAVDIDPYLKGLTKKYDFYWITGEKYFDEN